MTARARRTNRERRGESQERILDAAEALFARSGFNAVSTKDIGQAADVDPSLLHYYFATKAGLYSAVIARRADHVNVTRLGALQAYAKQAGDRLTVASQGSTVEPGETPRHHFTIVVGPEPARR